MISKGYHVKFARKDYQPQPLVSADNPYLDLDYSGYHKNLIQQLFINGFLRNVSFSFEKTGGYTFVLKKFRVIFSNFVLIELGGFRHSIF